MQLRLGFWAVAVLGMCVGADNASGQRQSSRSTESAKQEVRQSLDVDGLVSQAANNVSQRYNLNARQRERAQQMFQEGVNRFLVEHQDEIYPLMRDMVPRG